MWTDSCGAAGLGALHPWGCGCELAARGGRGTGGGDGCCRRIPQIAVECLFFLFFFLKNSSFSSLPLQTSTWLLTQPNSPTSWGLGTDQVRVCYDPTLPSRSPQSQPVHPVPVCLPLHPYSPLGLQASRSLLVLFKPCLAGEGAVDLALSQESCGGPSRH